jgi:drug/metabolite transporter (DMT)-like permease
MPLAALALVLVAACTHATWNLLAKRAAASRHFVWMYSVAAVAVWLPAVLLVAWPALSPRVAVALLGTGVLHVAYSLALQHAYRVADLSVVYPVVRGTGPLLAFVGAALWLGERPTWVAALGAGLVVVGVLALSGGPRLGRGLVYGVGTGALVASYTVWDGWAVKTLLLAPVLVDYAGNAFRIVVLSPRAWREREGLPGELRAWWKPALGVAVLGPLGYILVLSAMRLAPVSHVAPAREVSMLVAAWLGAKVLDERDAGRRIAASAAVVAGVVCLARG